MICKECKNNEECDLYNNNLKKALHLIFAGIGTGYGIYADLRKSLSKKFECEDFE